jgi:arylsulfatase A-like enzyme
VNPDVALLWFPEPDTSQHAVGVGAGPAIEALAVADAELGRMIGELATRGASPDVLVVSDHGYSTIARRIQLEEVVRAAGFQAGDRPGGVTVAANGGAALFYVRGSEPRALERFTRWLVAQPWAGALVAGSAAGVELGLLPADAVGLAGPRAPDVVLSFRWDGAPGLGTHGSGSPQELRCTLVGSGPSFRRGCVSELPSGNVDVAPTVLRLLGVTTDAPLDGRPLIEGLREATEPAPAAASPAYYEAHCHLGDTRMVFHAVVERVGAARYVASLSAERA